MRMGVWMCVSSWAGSFYLRAAWGLLKVGKCLAGREESHGFLDIVTFMLFFISFFCMCAFHKRKQMIGWPPFVQYHHLTAKCIITILTWLTKKNPTCCCQYSKCKACDCQVGGLACLFMSWYVGEIWLFTLEISPTLKVCPLSKQLKRVLVCVYVRAWAYVCVSVSVVCS